eukprot:1633286-Pleurochrysis_carterae.AAC.1
MSTFIVLLVASVHILYLPALAAAETMRDDDRIACVRAVLLLLAAPVCEGWAGHYRFVASTHTGAASCHRYTATRATCASLTDHLVIRKASHDELHDVAALQLEVFSPPPATPQLLPVFASLFEANQRTARREMQKRLTADLQKRVERGSTFFVAVTLGTDMDAHFVGGQYEEPNELLVVGAVDLSTQEMELPTHSLCDGMYLSHMAVSPGFRQRGLGRRLLLAAEAEACQNEAEGIYLHVEPNNEPAIRLYESTGFTSKPNSAVYATFTRALDLVSRNPVVMYKPL